MLVGRGLRCDVRGCVDLPPFLTSVRIEEADGPGTLRLNGRMVAYLAAWEAAEAALARGALSPEAGQVLVRDASDPEDAVGLSLHEPVATSGAPGLSRASTRLICTGR